jgi:cobyrinic acid a,c-diamide synthase
MVSPAHDDGHPDTTSTQTWDVPRVVIAAPHSGAGKTSVATGLLAAFRQRGDTVSPHKVGPDYIDPGYHAVAAGRPGRGLDPWLVGEDRIVPLFLRGALFPRRADIAIVEGAMGLFDGASGQDGFASTAHVARLLAAPVVLVVNAAAQARSLAALLHGFSTFDRRITVAGVILNRVGSDRHEHELRAAAAVVALPVLGAIRRHDELTVPSRHLGLIPAAERSAAARHVVAAMAAAIGSSVDLDAVARIARGAKPLRAKPWDPSTELGDHRSGAARPLVCVAGGAAFTFGYEETTELLDAAGADVAVVDPLRTERLPSGAAGLVVGGGFPELHAAALSTNEALRADVVAIARSGAPVAAECAGLLYLARSLDGAPMCGVIPADAAMTNHLTLGYREAIASTRSVLAEPGTVVRGHEFHRTVITPPVGRRPAWRWTPDTTEGFVTSGVHASYLHLNWAGSPEMASRFVARARRLAAMPDLGMATR